MKIIYTRPSDGGVSIITAAPREVLEQVLGPLTVEEYEAHVLERSIPDGAQNVRQISPEDVPNDREFREAWVDGAEDTKVNIDLAKAKQLKLEVLRFKRNAELEKLDKEFLIALESGQGLEDIKAKKKALRDITNPLKALIAEGLDGEEVLEQIRSLSDLRNLSKE